MTERTDIALSDLVFFFFWRPRWIKDTNDTRWFAIPYKAMHYGTTFEDIKKIALNLKASECRNGKHQKGRYDVI